jgi:glycosyltransferase involved in cell wall biosynthesis
MIKIVHIVEATATGTLSMVCECVNSLAARGHKVTLIYSRRPETPKKLEALFHESVTIIEMKLGGLSGLASLPRLRRILININPQIIHLHSSFAGFYGRIATLNALPKSRLFYSPHCISMMRTDITFRKLIYATFELFANIRNCTYVACSLSEKSAIRRWLNVEASLLENAVNFDCRSIEAPPFVSKHSNGLQIVTVGGIRPQKNPYLFARICTLLRQDFPEIRFMWIGDGEPQLVQILLKSGVEVLGWKEKEEVIEILRDSQLYLSTSSWEGMPVSVIEAMASGVPVLASNCSGNVDVIEHGVNGLIFQSDTEVCNYLKQIFRAEIDLSPLAFNASKQVLNRFSLESFSRSLLSMYEEGRSSTV